MNGGDQALNAVYLVGVLVLVGSSLAVRRVPMSQTLKMGAAWVLIFAAMFVVFALKDDFLSLGRHVMDEARGDGALVDAGETLRVKQSEDGHYWVDAKVNGSEVHFLVDSGATFTSLSAETARAANVDFSGLSTVVSTANGTVKAQRGTVGRLEVGSIVRSDFPVHVSEAFGDTNVLGMNFLSSLRGWGVEGHWLVLKP